MCLYMGGKAGGLTESRSSNLDVGVVVPAFNPGTQNPWEFKASLVYTASS